MLTLWNTLKKELLKLYARQLCIRLEQDCMRGRQVQERTLLEKIRRNQDTVFGQQFGFRSIRSIRDFRRAVPLSDYDFYRPYIERMKQGEKGLLFSSSDPLVMFAMTSGTTAEPKYIPVSQTFEKEYHHGSLIWSARLINELSDLTMRGKILAVYSPARQFQLPSGLWCGSISGAIAEMQRPEVQSFYAVPHAVSAISTASVRFYTIMRLAVAQRVSVFITANPSLVLSFVERVDREHERIIRDIANGTLSAENEIPDSVHSQLKRYLTPRPKRARELEGIVRRTGRLLPKDYWPELGCISCWTGGTLFHYLERFPEYFGSVPVREIGLLASEGRFSIPLDGHRAAGVVDASSHFYEFIPEEAAGQKEPPTLLAHEVKKGKKYFLVPTTSSGLYRYQIADLVEVIDWYYEMPVIVFLSKAKHFSSVTGEKLSEFQVVSAVTEASHASSVSFSCFRLFPCWANPPYYGVMVERTEAERAGEKGLRFLSELDRALKEMNIEYKGKRDSHRLGPLRLKVVADGTFAQEKKEKLDHGGSEEQYKPVYLSGDLKAGEKYKFVEERSGVRG